MWVLVSYTTHEGIRKDMWVLYVSGTLFQCVASAMLWLESRGCHTIDWKEVHEDIARRCIVPPICVVQQILVG